MQQWATLAALYALGAMVLIADIFVPSHFTLSLLGLVLIGFGLYEAFLINPWVGAVNAVLLVVLLPTAFVVVIRNWHRTPIGKLISPPNPKLTEADRLPVSDLRELIGNSGMAVSPLRPVGTCEFDGRRLECKAESGLIEPGTPVEAVGLSDRTVVVRAIRVAQV